MMIKSFTLTNFNFWKPSTWDIYHRITGSNKISSTELKKFSPEQVERLKNQHYTEFGYYPDSSFEARVQRMYNFTDFDYSNPDSNFSITDLYHGVVVKSLEKSKEFFIAMEKNKGGHNAIAPEDWSIMEKNLLESWELLYSIPHSFWADDPNYWHAFYNHEAWYPNPKSHSWVTEWAERLTPNSDYLPIYEGSVKNEFEPDILFWHWVLFPECIISAMLIFIIFTNVKKNRHFLIMMFWSFVAISLNAIIRAALYPAPNHFIIEDFYLCDIYSSYVKAVFYFLMSLYLLMLASRVDYSDTAESTRIHLIALLFLSLFTTAVISSFDLFFFYVAIEGMSFSTILMFVFSGKAKLTSRAAIRYFCLNTFASGCLLFSVIMLYGFCNNTSFTAFMEATHDFVLMPNSFIALVVFFFIFAAFKLALFPLGAWLPSIYGQLDYSTIYLFGVILKTVLLLVFFRSIIFIFPPMLEYFSNLFLGFGLLCLVFGAVAALSQQDLKKFLALTSISHMGSILISLHIMDDAGFASAFQYLGIYVVSSSVIFYCLATTRLQHKDGQLLPITLTSIPELRYFKSASSTNSTVALTISFVSMAGAAPLAGFWAKYSICITLMAEGREFLTLIFIFFSIISILYYLQVVRALWFDSKNFTDAKLTVVTGLDRDDIVPEAKLYIFGFLLSIVGYYFCYEAAFYHIYELIDASRCIFSTSSEYPVKITPTVEFVRRVEDGFWKVAYYIDFWWLHIDDYLIKFFNEFFGSTPNSTETTTVSEVITEKEKCTPSLPAEEELKKEPELSTVTAPLKEPEQARKVLDHYKEYTTAQRAAQRERNDEFHRIFAEGMRNQQKK